MPSAPKRTQSERRTRTRQALLSAARKRFSADGYAATATEAIVREAGVTRGALYHHFEDKRALFGAVIEEVERGVSEQIGQHVEGDPASDPVDRWIGAIEVFLRVSQQRDFQQIVLVDGPAVLGSEAWRELDAKYAFEDLMAALRRQQAAGRLTVDALEEAAWILHGAMNEAALRIARSPDPDHATARILTVFRQLITGLTKPGP